MKTRFDNAADAAAALSGTRRTARRVRRHVAASQVVTALLQLRTARGMTQAAVAKKMGCGQAKISKLEAGTDAQLSVADLRGYLGALGVNACLMIDDKNQPVAQRIKQKVVELHGMLEELAAIARDVQDDQEIVDKIHQFYGEVLLNFALRFGDSYEKVRALITLQPPEGEVRPEAARHSVNTAASGAGPK